jgi:hypothetical protein
MRFRWTADKIDKLRELYIDTHIDEICQYFGTKRHVVYCAAQRYNIARSDEFKKAHCYNVKPNIPTQFKKGMTSWNKGKKGIIIGGKETQFPKGHKPHNWTPEGTERISKDGYIEIKHNGKYRAKHRIIYEEHHGIKLDPYEVVIFLDRNPRNLDISNLKSISRQEHMQRNHWVHLPQELQEVIHLKKNITKLITEHGKRQNSRPETPSI